MYIAENSTVPEMPEFIPNRYIVIFKQGISSSEREQHVAWMVDRRLSGLSGNGHPSGVVGNCEIFDVGDGAVSGYFAGFDEGTRKEVESCDEVEYVEPDYKVCATKIVVQEDCPSWGLARLVHKQKITPEIMKTYFYDDDAAGEGTFCYIIDTGIFADHVDFEGRATFSHNTVKGSTNTDKHGHGTHVAGTVGGKTYGIAKRAKVIGVKVLGDDGTGSMSNIIAGLQWVIKDAKEKGINNCVGNLSLGGPYSKALNMVVKACIDKGLTIVVAAGHNGADARFYSPSSEPAAITVGAMSMSDTVPSWSNWGSSVDIFAPGSMITSCWIGNDDNNGNNNAETLSGTSMASAHVCALAAYLVSKFRKSASPLNSPEKVLFKMKELAVTDRLRGGLHEYTVNLLANTGESEKRDRHSNANVGEATAASLL